jgi:hypothetical protein
VLIVQILEASTCWTANISPDLERAVILLPSSHSEFISKARARTAIDGNYYLRSSSEQPQNLSNKRKDIFLISFLIKLQYSAGKIHLQKYKEVHVLEQSIICT